MINLLDNGPPPLPTKKQHNETGFIFIFFYATFSCRNLSGGQVDFFFSIFFFIVCIPDLVFFNELYCWFKLFFFSLSRLPFLLFDNIAFSTCLNEKWALAPLFGGIIIIILRRCGLFFFFHPLAIWWGEVIYLFFLFSYTPISLSPLPFVQDNLHFLSF